MNRVKALVLTGYGLNCDDETDFSLRMAGAQTHRVHVNELIKGRGNDARIELAEFHILVLGGGFSWADDHGAGVLMASKLKHHLREELKAFIEEGKLILGICNGFQALVNLGLLPGFENQDWERTVALTYNDSGNFIDTWVNLRVNPESPCIFTRGLSSLQLPVRHGEGKLVASSDVIEHLVQNNQVALQYAGERGEPAEGRWPLNPNGSLRDIAGICDATGRIFGLMPHPEAYNHSTNHPDWVRKKHALLRQGSTLPQDRGEGIRVFQNAVDYLERSRSPA